jgi:hypothetical protein
MLLAGMPFGFIEERLELLDTDKCEHKSTLIEGTCNGYSRLLSIVMYMQDIAVVVDYSLNGLATTIILWGRRDLFVTLPHPDYPFLLSSFSPPLLSPHALASTTTSSMRQRRSSRGGSTLPASLPTSVRAASLSPWPWRLGSHAGGHDSPRQWLRARPTSVPPALDAWWPLLTAPCASGRGSSWWTPSLLTASRLHLQHVRHLPFPCSLSLDNGWPCRVHSW